MDEAPVEREVVWKNLCFVGNHECILEFSITSHRFWIVCLHLNLNKFYVCDLPRQHATRLLKVCDQDMEKLMRLVSLDRGQLIVKNLEILLAYEQKLPGGLESIWPSR
jgi:hypothetical protein